MKKKKSRKRYSSGSHSQGLHRFFVSAENLQDEKIVLSGTQAHQIRDVLRLEPGENIIVLDNKGAEFEVALTDVARNAIIGKVLEKRPATGEPDVQITLYQSILKQDKFEWVLQKCTEVGVARFVPLITKRSRIRDCDTIKINKLARWRRIITEAAEQSHRGRIPDLTTPVKLEQGMAELEGVDCSLIASTKAHCLSLRSCLQDRRVSGGVGVALLVGPEGGFTEDELEHGQAGGAIPFNLGPRVLRTETAAVVASSLILYELGQFEP
jgi:16S rRNA (uracil1498-N3)-methyltransferase